MLTERQRWDLMRNMIKQNNSEYNSFLFRFFDPSQMAHVVASIRDNFLAKCKFSGENLVVSLEAYAKHSTKLSKTSWIDNLSSEDLLIFLDYRCRVLQQIYKYCKTHNNISKHDINYISANTLLNELVKHNNGRLTCGGRPEKLENEKNFNELHQDIYILQRQAINKTVDELMERCVTNANMSLGQVYQAASELTTYNVSNKGHVTGCSYIITQSEFLERMLFEPKPKHCGFNIQGSPIYKCGDKYYSSVGDSVQCEDVIFNSMEDEYRF